MSGSPPSVVGVEVNVGGETLADLEELEQLGSALRRELLDLDDIEAVDPLPAVATPAGARAVDPASIGAWLVIVGKTAGALRALTTAVRGWLGSQPSRTVKLAIDGDTLELTGVSSTDQERLVTAWIERHAKP